MRISRRDRAIIRDLARQVAEISADPIQNDTTKLWKKLNRLERTRPLIQLHDSTQHETGDKVTLTTRGKLARQQELDLRTRIFRWEHMRDDQVWEAVVFCPIEIRQSGWSIEVETDDPDHAFGARHYKTVIGDDEKPSRIRMPRVRVDWNLTERVHTALCDLYDGILEVRKIGVRAFWYSMFDAFIQWRGIEQAFLDMTDRPQWLHSWLERMCLFQLKRLELYEKLNILSLNNGVQHIGSGGYGCTDELPKPGYDSVHVRTIDMWGHATTQIFSDVSPDMHEEFALSYEKRLLNRFGLAYYGCCEPLDRKVDLVFRNIPNLRKISMSPWVNVERGAEALGNRAVFSYKPNPAILGMERWDVDQARRQLRDVFEKTRGCVIEVIMKDLHTCRGEVRRMSEWIEMAKRLSEEYA